VGGSIRIEFAMEGNAWQCFLRSSKIHKEWRTSKSGMIGVLGNQFSTQ
jgi:hypothetical protein